MHRRVLTMIDPKQGEREYFARIGEAGRRHAAGKPFSDDNCAEYLLKTSVYLLLMPPAPARVVEFGCGTGWLSLIFASRGYDVIGVDIAPEAIDIANQLAAERGLPNASFRVADYENVRIDPLADCVIFHDALHHAESEAEALRAAYAALKPGGVAICIEPGEGHSRAPGSLHAVKEFGVHEKDMPPATIIRHARAAGFGRHVVLPWPWYHMRSVYRGGYRKATSGADLKGRKWLSLWRLLRTFFRTKKQGVVVLWKD
jgi:SAM-dependent methyltransferase